MRRTKTKIEITIAKRQRTTIQLSRHHLLWCEQCAAQAQLLSTDEAALILQTTARAIFKRIEAGELHYFETENGALFVCRTSLKLSQQKTREKDAYHEETV